MGRAAENDIRADSARVPGAQRVDDGDGYGAAASTEQEHRSLRSCRIRAIPERAINLHAPVSLAQS